MAAKRHGMMNRLFSSLHPNLKILINTHHTYTWTTYVPETPPPSPPQTAQRSQTSTSQPDMLTYPTLPLRPFCRTVRSFCHRFARFCRIRSRCTTPLHTPPFDHFANNPVSFTKSPKTRILRTTVQKRRVLKNLSIVYTDEAVSAVVRPPELLKDTHPE
jgi:hypothetical protein